MTKKFLKLIVLIFLFSISKSFSDDELFIKDIEINRFNVADNEKPNISWLGKIINSLHIKTKEYVIKQELLFTENSQVNLDIVSETERNLRALGIFNKVHITLDSLGFDEYKAVVNTTDAWSSMFLPVLNYGGGFGNYGADLDEFNFLGTGTRLKLTGEYRNESQIGWQGSFVLFNPRIPFTDLQDSISFLSNKIRTTQTFILQFPFRTTSTDFSAGISYANTFGKDFYYHSTNNYELINLKNQLTTLWYSHAWWKNDRLYITGLLGYNQAQRENPSFRQAFDNSGYFLLNFASISQSYDVVNKINGFVDEDLIYGGYGSASIGKIFPLNSDGDNLNYISGIAEKSFYNQRSYLFLRVAGASGFDSRVSPKYTYQESLITYFHNFTNGFLITGRFSQQTVWNWPAWRQLILDNDSGVRGIELNSYSGDNRLVFNSEIRYFLENPEILFFKFSLIAFFDIGAVWNQNMQLNVTPFRKTTGLGVRFHFIKSQDAAPIFRVDFPYNPDTNKLGVVFTAKVLFPSFVNHMFSLPQLFGKVFDYD